MIALSARDAYSAKAMQAPEMSLAFLLGIGAVQAPIVGRTSLDLSGAFTGLARSFAPAEGDKKEGDDAG